MLIKPNQNPIAQSKHVCVDSFVMTSADFSGIRARYEDALNEQHFSDYLQLNNVNNAKNASTIASRIGVAPVTSKPSISFNNTDMNNIFANAPPTVPHVPSSSARSITPSGTCSSNQSIASQSVATLKSNRSKMSQKPKSSSQSVASVQSKSPSVTAQSVQSVSNKKSLRTQPCSATVVNLKQYQHIVEERLTLWIDEMQQRSNLRQADYRECDMLIQHSCRLMNRYKRLTCLTIEALLELDHEINDEEKKHVAYSDHVKHIYNKQIPALQQDMNSMRSLMTLLQHFIQRAEQKKQQQEQILQQQLQQQTTYNSHSI
jgi:hypothetical protein